MTIRKIGFLALSAIMLGLSSCLSDDEQREKDYSEWRTKNLEYFENAKSATLNGVKQYDEVKPVWDTSMSILMQWHNDRNQTAGKLMPLSNSTVDIKYILTTIDGDTIDSSYTQKVNGDSIYRCRPNEMITGFHAALTNMHIGDTVTTVIPYTAGYGVTGNSNIAPYSTLVFGIKLIDINAWETPSWRQ